jgi:hypothetical protein
MAAKRISMKEFERMYESETTFEMMERDGRTKEEHVRHNIQWFRDWAEETARRLEQAAEGIR